MKTLLRPSDNPFQYTGRENDGTGLYYYRARLYNPQMQRFLSEDPIGLAGGVNFYVYVGNNPVNYIDPLGLHEVGFNGNLAIVVDDNGNPVAVYPATSGLPRYMSPSFQSHPSRGPIPSGRYSFQPSDLSRVEGSRRALRNLLGFRDWGSVRVPLTPYPGTNTYGRGGFFIHGGSRPGSKGCIDLGPNDVDFYNQLKWHEGAVPVIVDYR